MKRILGTILALGLVVAACGGDDDLSVKDAWARNSPGMANAGAAYMVIEGGGEDDRLVSASVPAEVAGMAQVHEVVMNDGAMSMQEVAGGLAIPSGETVTLEPGSYHIMMMNLADSLEIGEEFTVTLTFEKAGTVDVEVEVREG
jgi:copper(I)-binding protein